MHKYFPSIPGARMVDPLAPCFSAAHSGLTEGLQRLAQEIGLSDGWFQSEVVDDRWAGRHLAEPAGRHKGDGVPPHRDVGALGEDGGEHRQDEDEAAPEHPLHSVLS